MINVTSFKTYINILTISYFLLHIVDEDALGGKLLKDLLPNLDVL